MLLRRRVAARNGLRAVSASGQRALPPKSTFTHLNLLPRYSDGETYPVRWSSTIANDYRDVLKSFKTSLVFPPATCILRDIVRDGQVSLGRSVRVHGYLGTRRDANRKLTFAVLRDMDLSSSIQMVCAASASSEPNSCPLTTVRQLSDHVPVVVEGTLKTKKPVLSDQTSKPQSESQLGTTTALEGFEIKVDRITALNTFPDDIIMKQETNLLADQRHLQIKNDQQLREALLFRGRTARFIREHLAKEHGFEEFETPLLFKSTPEGAREFLVPTRQAGMAYALPQSPQQYKQILMASGIPRYMQIARCFRDEDLRADRQPEFTQVDLEMAFANGEDVMNVVEATIKAVWKEMLQIDNLPASFARMSYHDAMSRYGSDKPDVRLGCEIHRIDHMLPVDLISKIGPLSLPIVETFKLRVADDPRKARTFIDEFMTSPEAQPFISNAEGQPGIFFFDSTKPLQGLQPFGFEAAEQLEEILDLLDGDIVIIQARKDVPFSGGSTPIGNLRLALHRAAVVSGLIPAPTGFEFLWVVDFPLFTQGDDASTNLGEKGFSSTHHPFTSPKTPEDVDLLLTAPLEVTADHYDLVVNGVELGGGSRRIHVAEMQEFILRNILAMSDERVGDFTHLLSVLKAGCPPHAGLALGFDRMIAVMLGKTSVRDVIAFPKSGRGEDLLVRSPTKMTDSQLATYHLKNA